MISIRKAREADIPAVHNIVSENLKEEYEPNMLAQFAQAWPEGSLVAEDMGKVFGYLLAVLPSPYEARVLLLVVVPSQRNRGTGAMMLASLLNQCALIGLKSISLEVRVSNPGAIRFYAKFGFGVNAILKKYYRDGEDAYLMRKVV